MESDKPWLKDCAIVLLLLSCAVLALCIAFLPVPACPDCNAKATLVISPGAEADVVSLIRSAEKSIDIEMYVFTSDDIVRELSEAVKRGVRVRVLMEPRVEDSRKARIVAELEALGVEVGWASFSYKLTHSKFIIVDGKRALVGSINFSESALTQNREAAVDLEGPMVAELVSVFEEDWARSGPSET
jgi:phosphatidylserine/phosphatidylglycerophosphate/cardiolipin synthase-like enzyme